MTNFLRSLAIESWTLYTVGICLIALRIYSRTLVLGSIKKLQLDDWLMVFIVFTFTGDVVSVNQVAVNGSNYMPPGAAEQLSPAGIKAAIWGSKMTLALEEFQLTTTWLVKACLLLMYSRLTTGLKEHQAVKFVGIYCAFGYVLVQILYLAVWCHPIHEYWRVPVKYPQCASYYNHLITATVFNVSSDLMMLCIPIPLIIKSQLPLKRKLVLCAIFSLGVFVILTAILNRYYNFTQPYSPIFLNWYIGEAATAVYVANVPLLWPLLKILFKLDTWSSSRRSRPSYNGPNSSSRFSSRFYKGSKGRSERLGSTTNSIAAQSGSVVGAVNESEEHIMIPSGPKVAVRTLQATDAPLELAPFGKGQYRSHTFAGDERLDEEKRGMDIVRTVEIEQHSASPSWKGSL